MTPTGLRSDYMATTVEPTLEPLLWALVWVIVIAIFIYRKGDPRNYKPIVKIHCHNCNDRGYRIISGQVELCECKDEDAEYEDELDQFIVSEIIDELEEEE